MSKLTSIWHSLEDKDKFEIFFLLFFIAVFVCVVLLGIAWSRGHDVDYFKERIVLIEQRMTGMDKRMDNHDMKFDKIIEAVNETRQKLNDEIQRNNEQDKWIEEWKKLPSLPKPKR
jgi:hypothetical protein